jgi:hypothetical protein
MDGRLPALIWAMRSSRRGSQRGLVVWRPWSNLLAGPLLLTRRYLWLLPA